MFYVTSLDGLQVEPLINIGTDFKMDQSVDGAFSVGFTCFPTEVSSDNPGYDFLRSESIVTVDGFDFKVKQFSDSGYSKRITAINTFFENGSVYVDNIFSGSHSLTNHLNYIMQNTGWTFTVDPSVVNLINFIQNFGNDNVISLLKKVCKYHQVEFIINSRNSIHIAKLIGPDNDYPYRYGHNVSDVVLLEDTTNLRTFIRGYGFEGLEVSYTSPNISIFKKKEADPIRDERFKDAVSLTNYIKASLTDTPELTIESTIPELTNRTTGERVWLIYEPLNVEMQTRILKQTKVLRDNKLVTGSVVFGTTLLKTSTDVLLEQQEYLNDNKDLIDDTNETIKEVVKDINLQFTDTETRIIDQYHTITSEYKSSISMNARELRTEFSQNVTEINNTIGAQYNQIKSEYTSSISQTAQQLQTTFNEKVTAINDTIAGQYTQLTAEYNSTIQQSARALRTDFTASINTVNNDIIELENYASSIEQTANSIDSRVSSQQILINSQGTQISSAVSSISQQADLISQKVSISDYDGQTIASKIEQSPYYVTINASKINFNGHVFGEGSTWTGNVTTSKDVNVGRTIYMDGGSTSITASGSAMSFNSWGDLFFQGRANHFYGPSYFYDPVSFVYGLSANDVGGFTFAVSAAGLTVRQNGAFMGICKFT